MTVSRRKFLKWVTANGIALSLSSLGYAQNADFAAHETLPGRKNWNPAANGLGRVDGFAKVTGAKLYASDFRAADLPGWPKTTSYALLVRAPDATHVYTGMDLPRLSGVMKPSVVVTADDLEKIGTRVPAFNAGDLFCPVGKTPVYMGQPVALLLFETFEAYDEARLALRDGTFVKFGEETGPGRDADYGAYRFTRIAGATPGRSGCLFAGPGRLGDAGAHSELGASGLVGGRANSACLYKGRDIRRTNPRRSCGPKSRPAGAGPRIRNPVRRSDVLEPESGLAWYDKASSKLEILLGVQSPYEATESIAFLLGKAKSPFKPARINAQFAHIGGGVRRARSYNFHSLCRARGGFLSRPPDPACT